MTAIALSQSAGQSLPSVDVETANLQIEQFENENRSLQSRVELLEESIERLEGEVALWNGWIVSIDPLTSAMDEQADLLFELVSGVGSSAIVSRIRSGLERYDQVSLLLESKKEELEIRVEETSALIENNRGALADFLRRIEQNAQNIVLLRSAIANSESSEARIEEYLENLDGFLEEALDLIAEPDADSTD